MIFFKKKTVVTIFNLAFFRSMFLFIVGKHLKCLLCTASFFMDFLNIVLIYCNILSDSYDY